MTEFDFNQLLVRVRQGDAQAAEELVRRFEPYVRRSVRARLTDPRLRRQMESIDICQSVLANFFVRAALGEFELESSEQLAALLVTMARNKLNNHARRQRAQRRDMQRMEPADVADLAVIDDGASPSQIVSNRELLATIRKRLTPEERYLADQRAAGRSWAELSAELGVRADSLRMKLARAIDRVSEGLGLESSVDGAA